MTLKQELFVEAYIGPANGNATKAAKIAGYKGNDHTLEVIGAENLRKPEIASRVRARVEQAAMSADEVLAELSAIARADWREFLQIRHNSKGEVVDAALLLRDKIRALELLGKYHALFTEKREIEHKGLTSSDRPTEEQRKASLLSIVEKIERRKASGLSDGSP